MYCQGATTYPHCRLNEPHLYEYQCFLLLVTSGRDHEIPWYISGIAGIYCQLVHSMLPTTSSRQQKHNPLIIHPRNRALKIIIVQVPSLTFDNLKSCNTSQTFCKGTNLIGFWSPLPRPVTTSQSSYHKKNLQHPNFSKNLQIVLPMRFKNKNATAKNPA